MITSGSQIFIYRISRGFGTQKCLDRGLTNFCISSIFHCPQLIAIAKRRYDRSYMLTLGETNLSHDGDDVGTAASILKYHRMISQISSYLHLSMEIENILEILILILGGTSGNVPTPSYYIPTNIV